MSRLGVSLETHSLGFGGLFGLLGLPKSALLGCLWMSDWSQSAPVGPLRPKPGPRTALRLLLDCFLGGIAETNRIFRVCLWSATRQSFVFILVFYQFFWDHVVRLGRVF